MNPHRYILEPYKGSSTRHVCPKCGKTGQFTRYIDTDTGQHLHTEVGKCERVNNCGHHYAPREFFRDHPQQVERDSWTPPTRSATEPQPAPRPPISILPDHLVSQSRRPSEANNFVKWLQMLFGRDLASDLAELYNLGTSKHWPGAVIFWQMDFEGRARTGKIMQYDPTTGRRDKKRINWVHSVLKLDSYHLSQCLFGEHLIRRFEKKSIAIVESEKTAIVCSVFLPQYLWLATGGIHNLNADKCKCLHGREVMLCPDLGAYDLWSDKAKQLGHLCRVIVSDYLEQAAPDDDRGKGYDLADYFVNPDPGSGLAMNAEGYPAFWDNSIASQ